jgi:hypothetical protein
MLQVVLDAPQDSFITPWGYELWADGLYSVDVDSIPEGEDLPDRNANPSSERRKRALTKIASSPIWIERLSKSVATGDEFVEIAYRNSRDRSVRAQWIGREIISDKFLIKSLSKTGFPVHSENAREIVLYLAAALDRNAATLPLITLVERSGMVETDQGKGWMLGETWIGPEGTCVDLSPNARRNSFARGIRVTGQLRPWLDRLRWVLGTSPLARWLTFATFAPPLLPLINHRTFIIHHWGNKGTGKSALAKFACSAMGEPQRLMQHMNRTQISFAGIFKAVSELPVVFDELQAVDKNVSLSALVMTICLEKGRVRSSKSGDLIEDAENWKSIVRLTGEQPILGNDNIDLGGQSNRVLQLEAAALTYEQAHDLQVWCERGEHSGAPMLAFLQALCAFLQAGPEPDHDPPQLGGLDQLRAWHREIRARLEREIPIRAHLDHLAVIALAHTVACVFLIEAEPRAALEAACRDAAFVAPLLAQAASADFGEQVRAFLAEHRVAHRDRYLDMRSESDRLKLGDGEIRNIVGVLNPCAGEQVWYLPTAMKSELLRAGYPPGRVWAELRPLMPPLDGKNLAQKRRIGTMFVRVYVINSPPNSYFPTDG